jgi:2-polyprenyl-3-methyl-5-hydroxy-6-metoxy-1,4-benzoquinol methylase
MSSYGRRNRSALIASLQFRPIVRLVERYALPAGFCIDVGAADGVLGDLLLSKGLALRYVGLERDAAFLEAGRAAGREMAPFDAEEDPFPDRFDVAICSHLVEHVVDPDRLLRALNAAMPVGATAIIITPNSEGYSARLMKDKWIALSDPTHVSLRSHSEWLRAFESAGFDTVFAGSSFLSNVPRCLAPVQFLSKLAFTVTGYVSWKGGNSSAFVLRSETKAEVLKATRG